MALVEINFDGIIGPSHNYAGLSPGNIASANNAGAVSQPRAAALQGVEKMRANLRLGLAQGFFLPLDRPNKAWLEGMATDMASAEPHIRAAAFSASAMWAPMLRRFLPLLIRRMENAISRRPICSPWRIAAMNGPERSPS